MLTEKYNALLLKCQIFNSHKISMHVKRATESHYWGVNIGSGNGLVQSGNNSLPDPVLTQIYDAIRRHNPHFVKLHLLDNEKKVAALGKTQIGTNGLPEPDFNKHWQKWLCFRIYVWHFLLYILWLLPRSGKLIQWFLVIKSAYGWWISNFVLAWIEGYDLYFREINKSLCSVMHILTKKTTM